MQLNCSICSTQILYTKNVYLKEKTDYLFQKYLFIDHIFYTQLNQFYVLAVLEILRASSDLGIDYCLVYKEVI